ncbi:MAG TPA: PilZ domain-containing protein [Clostridia bacterium]|nr:PilZ domain-containing protein [Clostridia bacterium]
MKSGDLDTKKWSASRKYQRFKADLRLKVILWQNGRLEVIHGRTSHLGQGGIGVTLTRELELGTIVTLEFSLPACEPFQIPAELRHRAGFRCGFQFLELTATQRAQIRQFCNELPMEVAAATR